MKSLQPVLWTKGTQLSPQQLQLQDRFLEHLVQFHLSNLTFRPWGLSALRINEQSLSAGVFAISSAAGILPDGLPFEIPGSDAAPPPKLLAESFAPGQEALDIYLGIPHYRERGLNVASGAQADGARYRAKVEYFRDENSGQAEKPVQIAGKNFALLTEAEARNGYSTLRVARVHRTAAGVFQLDPRFVPPLLEFKASDYLVSVARRLVEILSARSTAIFSLRRQRNQNLADFTASDIAGFWLLYTINSALPEFRRLFEVRGGHPEALYSAMLSLAGTLTTFSTAIHPRDLPAYDHNELGACFANLDEKLRALLETVVPGNFVALPLKQLQPAIYAVSIDADNHLFNTRMYLAIQAETTRAEIATRAPVLLKVCALTHIETLVREGLPGVALTHVPSPPSAVPVKLNYQYFSLNQSGPAWESIVQARNFAVYVPADLPNPQLELLILLPHAT